MKSPNSMPKGRANVRVHLGAFIKGYLEAKGEAPLTVLHAEYKKALAQAYPEKASKHQLHLPHYMSFRRFCIKLRDAGLIEECGREHVSPAAAALTSAVSGHDQTSATVGNPYRLVYKLTAAGTQESDKGLWLKPDKRGQTGVLGTGQVDSKV